MNRNPCGRNGPVNIFGRTIEGNAITQGLHRFQRFLLFPQRLERLALDQAGNVVPLGTLQRGGRFGQRTLSIAAKQGQPAVERKYGRVGRIEQMK